MYKTFSAEEWKKYFGLPEDYAVDGMICYGMWDKNQILQIFKEVLTQSGHEFKYGTLPGFLSNLFEFSIEGKRYWFDVSYGGTLLSEYLHLACAFGSKKNILLGSCGGLKRGIHGLDIIIPTYSWGNESATRMYNPAAADNKHYPDPELSDNLANRLVGQNIFREPTTTCQAMLAETWEDIENWSKMGFAGVEMEAATVFAVSQHFKVPSAAVLRVGDNLIEQETNQSDSYVSRKEKANLLRIEQFRAGLAELLA